MRPFNDPLASPAAAGVDLHIGKDDGSVSIRITAAGEVHITPSLVVGTGAHQIPSSGGTEIELRRISTVIAALASAIGAPVSYVPGVTPAPAGAVTGLLDVSGLSSD